MLRGVVVGPTVASRLLLVLLICSLGFPDSATAQENQVYRTVVLDVQPSGTDELFTAIATVDAVDIKDQQWFVEEIRSRDVKAAKIMERPDDAGQVMAAADVDYVIAVKAEDDRWRVEFFEQSGQMAHQFDFQRSAETFGADDAAEVREAFESMLGLGNEDPQYMSDVEEAGFERDDQTSGTRTDEDARASRATNRSEPARLRLAGAARMVKREVVFADIDGSVLSFQSALYPGGTIAGEFYPDVEAGATDLGFWLTATGGFDSLAVPDGESLSILQLEVAGGVGLRTQTEAEWELRLGGAHYRFTLPANDVFPSVTHFAAVVGAYAEHDLGPVTVVTPLDLLPFVFVGQGASLFGERNLGYGVSGGVDLRYGVVERLDVTLGARFRMIRSSFPGSGTLDFRDTRGFELVWGPSLGITWRQ